LAHIYGAYFGVDAAQSAGVLPLRLKTDNIDFICAAGHKGLYGTMGTGLLITCYGEKLRTFCEGGTGSLSGQLEQPDHLPDRFESGTLNVPGIVALNAGLNFVRRKTPGAIHRGEMQLVKRLYKRLLETPHVNLYTPEPREEFAAPVLSFNIEDTPSEELGAWLAERGIAVRCGLQCAPQAHRSFGTLDTGTVRVAPSAFSSVRDMDALTILVTEFVNRHEFRK
ncbi:MAG: aminotransferase class V-fold PLP-dependent enzyme, partial [Clostridia bacterium]|nr:aminotransferase class V-fold PLP-dependent enzyme [Clostridia bacterium]